MRKIGILTFHNVMNYGAVLQECGRHMDEIVLWTLMKL